MKPYDHNKIEKKWQKIWETKKPFRATENRSKKKFYALIEFPYASGDGLHVGHIRSNTAMDIITRKRRREGFEVLYPIGWDAFGLPTENYSIKTGIHPEVVTKKNTGTFRRQLKALGFSFDWSREINTSEPKYYKWTQWIFLQFLKKGLAYKKKMAINWCPKDMIGLANEEVVNGRCERCGTLVEKREKEQWMLAITKYADRLDKDLDDVDYLERIKLQQRNWIGKSEGAEIDFRLAFADKRTRFVIIHGYKGSAKTNFIPWLKAELEKRGHQVETPELPNSSHPTESEQVDYVLKNCKFDANTVVIGHSLGAVVAMKALMKLNKPISGLVNVAAAIDPSFRTAKDKEFWKTFTWNIDYSLIQKMTDGRIAVLSDLKEKYRRPYLKHLADQLKALLIETTSVEEHFCAKQEPEVLKSVTPIAKVFTTRPDTLFGVTYLVLAPEHPWVQELLSNVDNKDEVTKYIAKAKMQADIERSDITRIKTGVVLKGIRAVNPANNEEIPVWIADYVLPDYGTGAVMAVPAHDERDWEFAKKYGLPMKEVIEPVYIQTTEPGKVKEGLPFEERRAISAVVKHWSEDKYIALKWKKVAWTTFITGGIEGDQSPEDAAKREILEETGYSHPKLIKNLPMMHSKFYHVPKGVNRFAHFNVLLFKLENGDKVEISDSEKGNHDVQWMTVDELKKSLTADSNQHILRLILNTQDAYMGEGILMGSGNFTGKESASIKKEITASVGGKWVTTYKLRDWVFSRQRYWGEPIPVVHCDVDGIVPVPEKDLPVKLPKVKHYKPTKTGESPLAGIASWVNTKCPKCKGPARRETDTMPQWAGSSWYYLRYTDPKNNKVFADRKKLKYWTPVDWYNGGMEHTTLHLLYSRFWHKFLFDEGLVPTKEPYQKRTSHGLILAEGGVKMSKSLGNVVNPDSIIKTVGADALRLYEMFMGPFDQPIAWDTNNIAGVRRFIEKVWRLRERVEGPEKVAATGNLDRVFHQTIKKVTGDIESMRFNTAISSLMIAVNESEKSESMTREQYEIIIKLLAPFAPHVTEELWISLGHKGSVHMSDWPKYDPKMLVNAEVTIVVQINGKMRTSFTAPSDASRSHLENMAKNMAETAKYLSGKEIKKTVVVPNKLVNFVC